MKALVIYWDPHNDYVFVNGGAKRWLSAYIFTMEMFGFDTLYVVGKPGITHGYNIQHKEVDTLNEVLHENPDAKVVVMTGAVPEGHDLYDLLNYNHPEGDVIYVIGGDYSEINFEMLDEHSPDYVKITGVIENPNLWSHTVAAILLNDYHNG